MHEHPWPHTITACIYMVAIYYTYINYLYLTNDDINAETSGCSLKYFSFSMRTLLCKIQHIVMCTYMHINYEKPLHRYTIISYLVFIELLLLLSCECSDIIGFKRRLLKQICLQFQFHAGLDCGCALIRVN